MSSQAAKRLKTTLPTVPHLIVKTEEFAEDKSVTQETTVINETPIPPPTNTSIEAILAKRKAEKLEQQPSLPSTSKPENVVQPVAKLNVLEARMRQLKDANDPSDTALLQSFPATSFVTPTSSPQKLLPQKVTNVQFNEWYVEDGILGNQTTVCATVCNVYALKDELLGLKPLPNGDMLYWPSKMFYPNQVSNIMGAANVSGGSEFLKAGYGKPLIVFSRFSETLPDPLLKFDEVVPYLKEYIEGRTDEASQGNPKRTFHISLQRKPLNEMQIDALIAISARIYPNV
jgi:hypothetical protein